MKFGIAFVLLTGFFLSSTAFSSTPEMSCTSIDQLFRLDIYGKLGQINIFDLTQDKLSHQVTDLLYTNENNFVEIRNVNGNNGLPDGVIFEADMNRTSDNGVILEDGSRYNCSYN